MRNVFLAILSLAFFSLLACGPGNTVKLLPPPPLQASSLPAPNAPSVCVVNFEDNRMDPVDIGQRRDGTSFTTTGDVPVWISRALADELARKGFRVTFSMSPNQARSSNPDYLVTGIVQEVWIKEASMTELSVQLRVDCTLANRKGKIWSEACNTSQTKTGLPMGSFADELLLDTLKDLLGPVAQKISQSIEKK